MIMVSTESMNSITLVLNGVVSVSESGSPDTKLRPPSTSAAMLSTVTHCWTISFRISQFPFVSSALLCLLREPLQECRQPPGAEVEESCPCRSNRDAHHLRVHLRAGFLKCRDLLGGHHLACTSDVLLRHAV